MEKTYKDWTKKRESEWKSCDGWDKYLQIGKNLLERKNLIWSGVKKI